MTASDAFSSPARPAARSRGIAQRAAAPVLAIVFLLMVASPLTVTLGGTYFTSARLYCFILFVPVIVMWLSDRGGRILTADILLLLYIAWTFVCLIKATGGKDMVYATSQSVEILGSYLLARVTIRSKEDFLAFAKWLTGLILVLLPFAFFEAATRQQPLRDIFSGIPGFNVVRIVDYEKRMGLTRAQVTFEHPILFGTFCAMSFSMGWLALQSASQSLSARVFRAVGSVGTTFFSLSSGALAVLVIQFAFIGWDWVLRTVRTRWKILTALFAAFYVTVDMLSNRSPITILISTVTFSSGTAWYRMAIWDYGHLEVLRHPIFGMGLFHDYVRPSWMVVSSVDNHWLLMAMRYGFPGILLLVAAFFWNAIRMMRLDLGQRPDLAPIRNAYIFTLIGTFLALSTVNAWGAAQQFVFFFVGAGGWMLAFDQDLSQKDAAPAETDSRARGPRGPRLTRFPVAAGQAPRQAHPRRHPRRA